VKLCRFVLHEAPEQPRSGVYHDGKVYETDGERAIGIHDPGAIAFLPPLGSPPAVRAFETYRRPNGEEALTYRFLNPTGFRGPNSETAVSPLAHTLDFAVHVVGTVADLAEGVEVVEAPGFVLGYGLMIVFFDADTAEDERANGVAIGPSHDFGGVLGPYLTTPDELVEFTVARDPTCFAWRYRVRVNETEVASGESGPTVPLSQLLAFASGVRAVQPGELLAWPAFDTSPLPETPLGRHLLPADRIEVTVDGLGTLVARLT
jgi:2-keto-4-pentenoate hydratase/2-oxohepta-3-ene-1,7-dioic acid hydratase in catechol pathway